MRHLVLFLLLGMHIAYSQQDPQFSQFHRNRLLHNPGFAGMMGKMCVGSNYRTQWTGFPGAPKTFTGWVNAYVPQLRGGLAFHFTHDVLGFEKNTRLLGMYAIHRIIGRARLGLGISGNLQQKSLNGMWVAPDGATGDNSIPAPAARDWLGGMDAGAWFHGYRLYAGISATQITKGVFRDGNVHYAAARHYFVNAGTRFFLPVQPDFEIRFHFLGKSDAGASSIDLLAECWWQGMFYAGGGWRGGDAVIVSAGAKRNGILIGYSYDMTTSALRNHSANTHEISIRICCSGKIKCKSRSKENPRFMWGDRFAGPPECEMEVPGFNIDW